jgi:hypothetical protein
MFAALMFAKIPKLFFVTTREISRQEFFPTPAKYLLDFQTQAANFLQYISQKKLSTVYFPPQWQIMFEAKYTKVFFFHNRKKPKEFHCKMLLLKLNAPKNIDPVNIRLRNINICCCGIFFIPYSRFTARNSYM